MADDAGDGWVRAASLADVPRRGTRQRDVGEQDVLLHRRGEQLFAIGNRCTHQGAQLHDGPVKSFGSIVAVTCPAHGSMFSLNDGRVMRGPAMRPVAAYEVRVRDIQIDVRPVEASGPDA